MSYRTIKRAFGETNLERKCRVLFVVCLSLLILGAFLWVDRVAERLIEKTSKQAGHDLAKLSIFYIHWMSWETDPEYSRYAERMVDELLKTKYHWTVLSLEPDEVPYNELPDDALPENAEEEQTLRRLKAQWLERLEQAKAESEETPTDLAGSDLAGSDLAGSDLADSDLTGSDLTGSDLTGSDLTAELLAIESADLDPISEMLIVGENQYYYEPVSWPDGSATCWICHSKTHGAQPLADQMREPDDQPFRVIRVTTPYKDAHAAIVGTRAILGASAIATVFVGMLILYIIVRYVIVKPLQHLRDVSEEISRGNNQLRADIHTNDEFEELADAFNRMLRHLTEAQAELQLANDNLDGKVDELAQLSMRLYEMNRLKSDFLANMSHELRTPLNSIIGFSEVLQGISSLEEKQRRYACNIQKSGRILLEMINDILDLAKLEADKMEVRLTEFHAGTVIRAHCDMVRPLTDEKNIGLEVDIPDNLPPLFQDQSKVQQILTNLLSNAIKFTPEGGRIDVCVRRMGNDDFELAVADTGVGIPEEDREIIFEKFRQSATVLGDDGLKREYSGTGLGLSIVRELTKLLGGEITFQSELGRGSAFKIVLPWTLSQSGRLGSEIARKLSDLTHLKREDLQ